MKRPGRCRLLRRPPAARRGECGGDWWVVILGAALLATLAGCEKHEFEPPDREQRVASADSLFSPAAFDSVTWPSDSIRGLEGNLVYSAKCRQCHGSLGGGGTEYALERDLDVPSLVEPDWGYADDAEGLRRMIFHGHAEGMPTWGVAGISPREIDAAAYYITQVLRPDVLGGG